MAIRARPDQLAIWTELVSREEETGEIPLPAVETILLDQGRPTAVVLLAPEVLPNLTRVFADLGEISRNRFAQASLLALLLTLQGEARKQGRRGELRAIQHEGGLAYEFKWRARASPASVWNTTSSTEYSGARQFEMWGLLQAIARIGVQYPDRDASTPRTTPQRQ